MMMSIFTAARTTYRRFISLLLRKYLSLTSIGVSELRDKANPYLYIFLHFV